jgi:DNA polymerase III subunit epsilon
MREIVLDTETTGLDPKGGDRLIELGCIELVNRIPTGREYHCYFTPEGRAVHPEAEAVHGLSASFLVTQPRFADEAPKFLEFIGNDPLIIHNASFDIGFLNHELERLGHMQILTTRVVDTLALARRRHPAGPNSLDALCKRYGIDNSQRIKHGAIMDSLLLASVYVELLGERQTTLSLGGHGTSHQHDGAALGRARQRPVPLETRVTAAIEQAHQLFVDTLGPKALWKRFTSVP